MSVDEVRTLVSGRGLVESPRWHGDRLYFSDWSAGEVIAVDLAGTSEVVARVESFPLCTAWLPDGRMVIVSSQEGRLLCRDPDGSLDTFAELGAGGWNDIVVDGRGNAYVNAIGFDMMAGEDFKPGFVATVAADGSVRQVADDIAFPNGMAVTPDNATLIVAARETVDGGITAPLGSWPEDYRASSAPSANWPRGVRYVPHRRARVRPPLRTAPGAGWAPSCAGPDATGPSRDPSKPSKDIPAPGPAPRQELVRFRWNILIAGASGSRHQAGAGPPPKRHGPTP